MVSLYGLGTVLLEMNSLILLLVLFSINFLFVATGKCWVTYMLRDLLFSKTVLEIVNEELILVIVL